MAHSWTRDDDLLALDHYLRSRGDREADHGALARLIGVSEASVKLRSATFAGMDSDRERAGNKGIRRASAQTQEVWREYHADAKGLAKEVERIRRDGPARSKDLPDTNRGPSRGKKNTVENRQGSTGSGAGRKSR